MSRTYNTDPYDIQARRQRVEVYHVCDRPDSTGECLPDERCSPATTSRGLPRWLHCRWLPRHPGGSRSGQSEAARFTEGADRSRVRDLLLDAAKVANSHLAAGDWDALDDLDVAEFRRDISWVRW